MKMAKRKRSLSKRVARLESRFKTEMKSITWNITGNIPTASINTLDMTTMDQGVADNERVGDKIKVWRVEIRGKSDSNQIDHYVIQKHGTSNLIYSDFTGGKYAFLDSFREGEFTEWLSWNGYHVTNNEGYAFRKTLRFPRGIVIHYSGIDTTPVRNGLLMVSRNTNAVSLGVSYVVRVWYTDN